MTEKRVKKYKVLAEWYGFQEEVIVKAKNASQAKIIVYEEHNANDVLSVKRA